MNNQKLLAHETAEADSDKNNFEEPVDRISVAQLSAQQSQFVVPYELELAGNRLSPLHEW